MRNMSEEIFPTPENWTRWKVGPETKDLFFFESMDDEYWYQFQIQFWWIFWVFTASYWVLTYSLQRFMKNKKPLSLEAFMVTYNTLVAIFSIFALWRLSTTFFPILFSGSDGFYKSVCTRFPVTQKDAFWLVAYGWSKIAHFMDTIFAVLRKKPIQFMQMYHHSLVVLVPQHILPYGEPILMWFGFLNLLQHSITYPYFTLKALKLKVPRMFSTLIVVVEVLQMLAGLGIGFYTLSVLRNGGQCVRHPSSISIMYFVYATMTILAVRMAYQHFTKQITVEKDKSS